MTQLSLQGLVSLLQALIDCITVFQLQHEFLFLIIVRINSVIWWRNLSFPEKSCKHEKNQQFKEIRSLLTSDLIFFISDFNSVISSIRSYLPAEPEGSVIYFSNFLKKDIYWTGQLILFHTGLLYLLNSVIS